MATALSPLDSYSQTLAGLSALNVHSDLLPVTDMPVAQNPTTPSTRGAQILSGVQTVVGSGTSSVASLFGLSLTRVVAIILGLLVLAGALFLFGADEILKNPGATGKVIKEALA